MDDLIKALQIFMQYGNPICPTHCVHDILYVMINPCDVSTSDKQRLIDLGFMTNEEHSNFKSYRYGSA